MEKNNLVSWGSIAVSMEKIDFTDKLFVIVSLVGALVLSFPQITAAHTAARTPLIFNVNEISIDQLSGLQRNYLGEALADDIPIIIPDPRIALLQEYLQSKRSPLASEADVLLTQYHYRLIIGISFAESNFCKIQIRPNNCWGIGGTRPESYETLSDGIIRANNLIQKYHNNGMTTPKLMRNTWVGWHNNRWILAVEQISRELELRGL